MKTSRLPFTCETRCVLDEHDFRKLVSGEVVEQDNVKLILQDVGYNRMSVIIDLVRRAQEEKEDKDEVKYIGLKATRYEKRYECDSCGFTSSLDYEFDPCRNCGSVLPPEAKVMGWVPTPMSLWRPGTWIFNYGRWIDRHKLEQN